MKERYSVYCPVVPLASTATPAVEGYLLEIDAQPHGFGEDSTDRLPAPGQSARSAQALDDQADRKQWDRVAAPLRPTGLYESGCTAAAAVRKRGLKKPLGAVYQALHRQAYVNTLRLHLVAARAPSEWQTRAGMIEGRSAELALALALLLAASRGPHHLVIATGRLGGQPAGTRPEDPDVEVLSVGKLPEKLRLVEELAKTRNLPRGRDHTDPIWLFTPTMSENGGESVTVEALPEVARLKDVGITVIPVKTLGEAARRLKAQRARWMWQDSAWIGGIFCVPLILGAVIYGWLQPRLPATPTQLEINVLGQSEKVLKPLQNLSAVYLDDTLILRFSLYPGKFGYILQLQSDGDAYIESLPSGKDKDKSIPMNKFLPSMTNLTLLMLVTHESWSIDRQENIEKTLSALRLQPQLPPGVQYHFAMKKCTPMKSGPVMTSFTFKGPQVILEDSTSQAVCADWAKQLLETLSQETQGKIQLSGYTFKVDPY